jgi:hypothetical protein
LATGKTRRKPTTSAPKRRTPVKRKSTASSAGKTAKRSSPKKPADGGFKPSGELNSEKNGNSSNGELSSSLLKGYGFESSEVSTPQTSPSTQSYDSRAPKENFQYDGKAPGDYRNAQNSPDPKAGTKANREINQEYQALSESYRDYLGGDVASFPALAKNGSHLAGQQIQNLENSQLALQGDPQAMTDAMRGMANKDNLVQGAMLGKGIAERAAGDEKPSDALTNPVGTAGKVAGETVGDGLNTMNQMRDSLVAGNTEIHHSAAPAAHAFLKGESNGGKGMEELRKSGYYPGSEKDPHGLYTKAYSMLPEVRELGLQASKETDPANKKQLEKQRDDLMKKSNLHLFTQEQLTLEQPKIYENQTMKNAIGSIGGTMTLDGPSGRYDLLPNGGDWTDFKTRMGYDQVDKAGENTVSINGKDGKPIHYQPDPNAVGTVSHYSAQSTVGDNARRAVDTPVKELGLPVTTSTGAGVDGIGHGLSNGNAGEVAGSAATLPARMTSDVSRKGGQALQKNGNSVFQSGLDQYQRNLKNRPGVSDDIDRALGFGNMVVGDVRGRVGNGIETTGKALGTAAEIADKGIEVGVNKTVDFAKAANRKAYKARISLQKKLGRLLSW